MWDRYGDSQSAKFISVPFEGVVAEIMRSVSHRHWGVVLHRAMLMAVDESDKKKTAITEVTGDAHSLN